MKLIVLSIAWVCGIYIGSVVSPSWYVFLAVFILSSLFALFWRRRRFVLWAGLCLIVLFGGIGCYQWRVSEPTVQLFSDYGTVELKGEVERDPHFDDGGARLTLTAQEIRTDGVWEEVSGRVLIYTTAIPSYSQGDVLKVTGEIELLTGIEDSGYKDYLERQGFCSTMSYPQIEFIQRGWLLSSRNRLSRSLSDAVSEPQSSLAQALLLGIRSHIPDTLVDSFRRSGTSHLLAVSGLHVAMLAGVVLSGAAWLFGRQRPIYLVVAFTTIWLYALLTGMRPPAFRAAIMLSLFLTALWLGRPRSALPSLALAAAVMVGLDPSVLRNASFQLSFVAVGGIVLLVPPFTSTLQKGVVSRLETKASLVPSGRLMVQTLIVGLAATVAVYPLIAYYFGYVSLVGVGATFFALLALPGAIVLALLTAALGLFAPPLSWVAGWVAWLFLSYIIEVVEGFEALPFASYEIGPVNGIAVWAYYGVLVAVLSRKHLAKAMSKPAAWVRERIAILMPFTYRVSKRWTVVPLLIAAALVWLAVLATPDGRLKVVFIDVGQGDSIFIQTPSGHQILIDGGPHPDGACLVLGEELPFWDKSLDLIVLTHPENDHIAGLLEVLRRYEVGQVLEPGFNPDSDAYDEWLRLVEQNGIERIVARAGQRIELGDEIGIEVLHPQEEFLKGTGADVNNNSIVLRLVWKQVSFLLTGDICEEAEREMLYSGIDLEATVLKVAHHGSADSTCAHFLAVVDPQVAVICAGEDNPFGHPSGETLSKLSGVEVYRTDEQGTVTFTTDGEGLWVETDR